MKKILKFCAITFLVLGALILLYLFCNTDFFSNPTLQGIFSVIFFLFGLLPEEFLFIGGGKGGGIDNFGIPNPITIGIVLLLIPYIWFYTYKFISYIFGKIGIQNRFFSILFLLIMIISAAFMVGKYRVNECIIDTAKSNDDYKKGIIHLDNQSRTNAPGSNPLLPYDPNQSWKGRVFFFIHGIPHVYGSFEIDQTSQWKDDAFIKVIPGTEIKTICNINESVGDVRTYLIDLED